jgi:hypothetical protein
MAFALWAGAGRAAEPWRAEFDAVCAQTQDAMALKTEELKALVARCDALKPVIDGLDESTRKVYSRRLKGCRDLYQFVVDFREKEGT